MIKLKVEKFTFNINIKWENWIHRKAIVIPKGTQIAATSGGLNAENEYS